MSTSISKGIISRLTGVEDLTANPLAARALAAQVRLAALLTTNIDGGGALAVTDPISGVSRPRIAADSVRWGSKGLSVLYPEVTFRPSSGPIDLRFMDGAFAVDNPAYDFEVWDNSLSATLLSDIGDCLLFLLDMRYGAPPLPLALGKCYWCETLVTPVAWPDRDLKAWFTLWRVHFVEAR